MKRTSLSGNGPKAVTRFGRLERLARETIELLTDVNDAILSEVQTYAVLLATARLETALDQAKSALGMRGRS